MKFNVLTLIMLLSVMLHAQNHEHDGHNHGDSLYEFGISLGAANLVNESEYAASAHVHILRKLGEQGVMSHLAVGAGFEYIFAEHKHYSLVTTLSVNPVAALIFDISPGILFTEYESEEENQFVTHFELTYEFDLKGFGMGPVVGYGIAQEDNHFMFGIHSGIGL